MIAAAVADYPDTRIFASFPGVGPLLTGVLLAEIGEDRALVPCAAVLLAEAGLAPVTGASGRYRTVRFRYAANTRLREAATWSAFNSIKHAPCRTARAGPHQPLQRTYTGSGATRSVRPTGYAVVRAARICRSPRGRADECAVMVAGQAMVAEPVIAQDPEWHEHALRRATGRGPSP